MNRVLDFEKVMVMVMMGGWGGICDYLLESSKNFSPILEMTMIVELVMFHD